MIKLITLALVLVNINISAGMQDKIVGGSALGSIEESPYSMKFKYGCDGSIIAKNWILTAAHCKSILSYGGIAGTLDAQDNTNVLKVDKVIIHPKYNGSKQSYDFALVKLKDNIIFTDKMKAIKLADEAYEQSGMQSEGVTSTVYGWGLTAERGKTSRFLNFVEVPIVSNETANEPRAYNGAVDETMIAAGFDEGGKDACQGDSGGPLVTFNSFNEPVLVGVVSWGQGCARKNKFGIYSRVSFVHKWIIDTMAKN
jgi:secreted trypsin-like serine protease